MANLGGYNTGRACGSSRNLQGHHQSDSTSASVVRFLHVLLIEHASTTHLLQVWISDFGLMKLFCVEDMSLKGRKHIRIGTLWVN